MVHGAAGSSVSARRRHVVHGAAGSGVSAWQSGSRCTPAVDACTHPPVSPVSPPSRHTQWQPVATSGNQLSQPLAHRPRQDRQSSPCCRSVTLRQTAARKLVLYVDISGPYTSTAHNWHRVSHPLGIAPHSSSHTTTQPPPRLTQVPCCRFRQALSSSTW